MFHYKGYSPQNKIDEISSRLGKREKCALTDVKTPKDNFVRDEMYRLRKYKKGKKYKEGIDIILLAYVRLRLQVFVLVIVQTVVFWLVTPCSMKIQIIRNKRCS
jgi:hypothetical protein